MDCKYLYRFDFERVESKHYSTQLRKYAFDMEKGIGLTCLSETLQWNNCCLNLVHATQGFKYRNGKSLS